MKVTNAITMICSFHGINGFSSVPLRWRTHTTFHRHAMSNRFSSHVRTQNKALYSMSTSILRITFPEYLSTKSLRKMKTREYIRPLLASKNMVADTVVSTSATLNEILHSRNGVDQRYIFFGGKGGVGKTSTSAAVAVKCADSGLNTLIISTDPAHSLGDALDQNIGGGVPVAVQGMERLWAMEIDPSKAIQDFEEALDAFDVATLASSLGVPVDIISNLGLEEFGQILKNPPPGIDELVALAGVLKLAKSDEFQFDRIIIDTAPTGHTLRLLSFPDFLDQFLDKLINLRERLDGIFGMFASLLGKKENLIEKADLAVKTLIQYRAEIVALRDLFLNSDSTEFCIVTIPTQLAYVESIRLLESLNTQGVSVRNIVLNQLMDPNFNEQFMRRLQRGQDACIERLRKINEAYEAIKITTVPFFDMEVTGVYPLRYMGEVAFGGKNLENWSELVDAKGQRFVIVGGKGGVGKTSSSAALAIKFSDAGHNTVVVSTDPAHSLGDALQIDLGGKNKGELVKVPGGLATGGSLYAMEVDTDGALAEFKEVVSNFFNRAKTQKDGDGGSGSNSILNQLKLEDFAAILDNAPPGTDELVALSKVLKLVRGENKEGIKFDRIVIDTAPTGHTLRMLSYPEFLDDFFEKMIKIRGRFKNAGSMLNMFGGSIGNASDTQPNEEDRDLLRDFQFKMMELQELFRDKEICEFVVVTIPTILAVSESERLLHQLQEQSIPVKHMLVNKVTSSGTSKEYVQRLAKGQLEVVLQLEAVSSKYDISISKVPMFDAEVRGIYGLRAMYSVLFDNKEG